MTAYTCPNCQTAEMRPFYSVQPVPVHSVLLLPTREEAVNFPTGNITLGFCEHCGFIANTDFDASLHDYSARYEATQSYSPTFSKFSRRLATDLINRHHLHHKRVLEIGCGQGEFLTELCELGDNRGIGFDPAYVPERSPANTDLITFVVDFYGEKYADQQADFVVCKMTLEHIDQTAGFVGTVRRTVGDQPDTVVFFQIPNATRVLRDLAFWDVYYEHCSYFTRDSLAYLFRSQGFEVLDVWTDYDDQYLMIEARPGENAAQASAVLPPEALDRIRADVAHFETRIPAWIDHWRGLVRDAAAQQQRVVIWGGGSKGVAFLTTLGIRDEIEYAVDINPHKNGMYMAGTGQQTVLPEVLKGYRPDLIIVMNPIYCPEIQSMIDDMGVTAQLIPLEFTSD
ncbi:MAG: methyltransferase domain-containing protein [Chloroflexi bacterium]|nr:methyltransferase domain-containing protein [Chloroflexota bacterium]